jgi:hypothetical protein
MVFGVIIPAAERNINPILKKLKFFQKNACFFGESLVSYLSACERRSLLSDHADGRCNEWRSVIFVARA